MKKHLIITSALSALILSSCSSKCYDKSFAESMIGSSSSELTEAMGFPATAIKEEGKSKIYAWEIDESFVSIFESPAKYNEWRDLRGRVHVSIKGGTADATITEKRTGMIFSLDNDKVVDFRTFADDDMCNKLVPPSYILKQEAQ